MRHAKPSPTPAQIDLTASDWVVRRSFGLTADEQVELARWEAADPCHADALTRHANTWAMLDRPRNCGKGDLIARQLAGRSKQRRRWRAGAAAAVMTVTCLIALAWRGEIGLMFERKAPSARGAIVLMPETRSLPDGSIVELGAATEITLNFDGITRRVILRRGAAHFEVVKDPQRSFVVSAAGVDVHAVGTAFAVQLGQKAVEVLVTKGRVSVARRDLERVAPDADTTGDTKPLPIPQGEITAGQCTVVNLDDASVSVENVPPAQMARRLAWRTPHLEFSDTPLAEAVALMNRFSTVRIEIADQVLARTCVNGRFSSDNAGAFVRLVEASCDAKAERSGDTIVLRRLAGPGR